MFNFDECLVLKERMHFVLSSQKWIKNLLSKNYSQSVENFCIWNILNLVDVFALIFHNSSQFIVFHFDFRCNWLIRS